MSPALSALGNFLMFSVLYIFYIDVAKCKIKGAIFDCFEKTLVKAFTKHKK